MVGLETGESNQLGCDAVEMSSSDVSFPLSLALPLSLCRLGRSGSEEPVFLELSLSLPDGIVN